MCVGQRGGAGEGLIQQSDGPGGEKLFLSLAVQASITGNDRGEVGSLQMLVDFLRKHELQFAYFVLCALFVKTARIGEFCSRTKFFRSDVGW